MIRFQPEYIAKKIELFGSVLIKSSPKIDNFSRTDGRLVQASSVHVYVGSLALGRVIVIAQILGRGISFFGNTF